MGLSVESRGRIYEEDRVREAARNEIQRESKQRKKLSLGSLGINAVVLIVGLAAVIIGCGNGDSNSAPENALVPDSVLYADAHAKTTRWPWQEGPSTPGSRFPFLLEFETLSERPLEGGGLAAEILVPGEYARGGEEDNVGPGDQPLTYKKDVKNTGEFILWQVWPKKHFTVLVYNAMEAWEARGLCEQAHEGQPSSKFDEIEGGPTCTRATQLEKEHLLLKISRNPSTREAKNLWTGPDQP